MACQMPLKLGLPSDVRADPDAGTALERVRAIAIPAPTAAERMTITIVEPLIRLLMVNSPPVSVKEDVVMIIHAGLMSSGRVIREIALSRWKDFPTERNSCSSEDALS